jgi:hypothetical protein
MVLRRDFIKTSLAGLAGISLGCAGNQKRLGCPGILNDADVKIYLKDDSEVMPFSPKGVIY